MLKNTTTCPAKEILASHLETKEVKRSDTTTDANAITSVTATCAVVLG